jgi:hypothetical protein
MFLKVVVPSALAALKSNTDAVMVNPYQMLESFMERQRV